MPIFVDKDGSRITHEQWKALRADQDYVLIRNYLSDTLRVIVLWHGMIDDPDTPPEHYKPFELAVFNIRIKDGEGNPIPRKETIDPDATNNYRTAREAIQAYEDFLVRYSLCEWLPGSGTDENGNPKMIFIERGNLLAPLSPDVPSVNKDADPDTANEINSW
jgi:hypothetical protein